ncbi:MAG TPA: GNAT family N-acetyltransferase [Solirubrobacterales bacterium]|jgi:GNAT superfamily N-acetyltransferase|nr:GNAT family N-acetyltransferase [Solirubrobacterales bacterium]
MRLITGNPTAEEFSNLRRAVGWDAPSSAQTEGALYRTSHAVRIEIDDRLCAFGRLVSDGMLCTYFQDMMVTPELQRQGLGTAVMRALQAAAPAPVSGGFRGLIAIPGTESFYERQGFTQQVPQNTVMVLDQDRRS